ncbi:MAG TPA: sensor histidine kinase [Pseudonocardiaceae bacterium]|jgi:signal transduction histidine kinase|nr:sensor histidine kinase [Pseudonocardiaceae bacterium]
MEADRPGSGSSPAKQVSIGLIGARRVAVLAGHALRDVVAGDHPILPPWPTTAGGRWNRRAVLLLLAAVVITGWILVTAFRNIDLWSPVSLFLMVTGGLAVASILACYRRPLLGFRLSVVTSVVFVLLLSTLYFLDFDLGPSWLGIVPVWLLLTTLIVLFSVAEQHRLAELAWVWVLSVAGLTFGGITTSVHSWAPPYDDSFLSYAGSTILPTALLTGAVALVGYVVQLARVANEQRIRRTREAANTALLQERGYIARELHDVVAHHMSMLALRADSAPYRFPDLPEDVRTEFAALCTTAREGLTEMRRLLGVLREDKTVEMAPQPSLREIKDLVDGLRAAGTQVSLSMFVVAEELPTGIGLSAYRIVQEALSNAVRHSPGSAVRVEVWTTDAALHIEVANTAGNAPNPPGAEQEERPARHGLLGMRERVNMLDGQLTAGPDENGGFTVLAVLPLHDGLGERA